MYNSGMITYKAMYKFYDDGVHAEVLDFPGAISCGQSLEEARTQLAAALVDMAETHLMFGKPLPQPDHNITSDEADIEEPIYLLLAAASSVQVAPVQTES